jgi:hypothetical protein
MYYNAMASVFYNISMCWPLAGNSEKKSGQNTVIILKNECGNKALNRDDRRKIETAETKLLRCVLEHRPHDQAGLHNRTVNNELAIFLAWDR